jgi:hypothetical protein
MSDILSPDELAANYATLRHIEGVRNLLNLMAKEILDRGEKHDQEKMKRPELPLFAEFTPKLSACTYNSPEYNEMRAAMKPALDHHYATYRHHPEHFPRGIEDMTLVDIIEMFCDWKASSARHNDGNLLKSIEANRTRFLMSDQLVNIFKNTASLVEQK